MLSHNANYHPTRRLRKKNFVNELSVPEPARRPLEAVGVFAGR
jgi:hypothetical protein